MRDIEGKGRDGAQRQNLLLLIFEGGVPLRYQKSSGFGFTFCRRCPLEATRQKYFAEHLHRQTMLRPALPRIGHSLRITNPPRIFRRTLRTRHVPILSHDFTNGVPGLLSPAGFDMAWTQYQELMVERLNVLTAGRLITTQHIVRQTRNSSSERDAASPDVPISVVLSSETVY